MHDARWGAPVLPKHSACVSAPVVWCATHLCHTRATFYSMAGWLLGLLLQGVVISPEESDSLLSPTYDPFVPAGARSEFIARCV